MTSGRPLHRSGLRWTRIPLPAADPLRAGLVQIVHVPHSQAMLAAGYTAQAGKPTVGLVLAFGTLPR